MFFLGTTNYYIKLDNKLRFLKNVKSANYDII